MEKLANILNTSPMKGGEVPPTLRWVLENPIAASVLANIAPLIALAVLIEFGEVGTLVSLSVGITFLINSLIAVKIKTNNATISPLTWIDALLLTLLPSLTAAATILKHNEIWAPGFFIVAGIAAIGEMASLRDNRSRQLLLFVFAAQMTLGLVAEYKASECLFFIPSHELVEPFVLLMAKSSWPILLGFVVLEAIVSGLPMYHKVICGSWSTSVLATYQAVRVLLEADSGVVLYSIVVISLLSLVYSLVDKNSQTFAVPRRSIALVATMLMWTDFTVEILMLLVIASVLPALMKLLPTAYEMWQGKKVEMGKKGWSVAQVVLIVAILASIPFTVKAQAFTFNESLTEIDSDSNSVDLGFYFGASEDWAQYNVELVHYNVSSLNETEIQFPVTFNVSSLYVASSDIIPLLEAEVLSLTTDLYSIAADDATIIQEWVNATLVLTDEQRSWLFGNVSEALNATMSDLLVRWNALVSDINAIEATLNVAQLTGGVRASVVHTVEEDDDSLSFTSELQSLWYWADDAAENTELELESQSVVFPVNRLSRSPMRLLVATSSNATDEIQTLQASADVATKKIKSLSLVADVLKKRLAAREFGGHWRGSDDSVEGSTTWGKRLAAFMLLMVLVCEIGSWSFASSWNSRSTVVILSMCGTFLSPEPSLSLFSIGLVMVGLLFSRDEVCFPSPKYTGAVGLDSQEAKLTERVEL